MSSHLVSELSTNESARCGRCAEILPDETLTYCPTCGVPFSRVPPTNSYIRFEEKMFAPLGRNVKRLRDTALGFAIFAIFYLSWAFLGALKVNAPFPELSEQRKLDIHFYDAPEYPALDRAVKRSAVTVALQAFEDHFGITLRDYRVREDDLPVEMKPYFKQAALSDFSTWEKTIIPHLQKVWGQNAQGPLHILITNVPITANGNDVDIETRHLAASKLISGLGHPAVVVVSSFRMLTEKPEYASSKFSIRTRDEQARHLGEYLLAHELGHALLGFTDYIIEKPAGAVRAPASLTSNRSECLMHTDEAGGFTAWENIRRRPLGRASNCDAYFEALSAFRDRDEAITLYKLGRQKEAANLHSRAIELAKHSLNPWVSERWRLEHDSFLSLFERWKNRLLVFQSEE